MPYKNRYKEVRTKYRNSYPQCMPKTGSLVFSFDKPMSLKKLSTQIQKSEKMQDFKREFEILSTTTCVLLCR
jgi:hypothetical protein